MRKRHLSISAIVAMLVAFLVMSCGGGNSEEGSGTNTAIVNAATRYHGPVANAGPDQNVSTGSIVTLNGSESTNTNGRTLTYSWTFTSKPAGSTAMLAGGDTVNPSFTADQDGSYIVQLIVNDGKVYSAADTVTITAATENSAPVANAGLDQNISTGSVVTLNGSGSSDANSDTLTFSWSFSSKPEASNAALTGATTVAPSFTADKDGYYVVQLVVNDGKVNSAADMVAVTAATANSAPVANAGPDQNVATGTQVILTGNGSSDADGDTLTFSWSFTSKPAGSTATLTAATTVSPLFTPDRDGAYVMQLIVNDGTIDSASDTVTVTASTFNAAPVANAGPDRNVSVGTLVTLDGSASSDANGDILTYSWSLYLKPVGSTAILSSTTVVGPSFTADVEGSYVLRLIVNDGTVNSVADPVTVTATPWSPTATTGAASARYWHTAIWTGTEMINWGGFDGISQLNTGGRYFPALDAWTATSVTGAPSGRIGHSAVWTGSKMIVWGGQKTDYSNDGGIYDPALDAWTTMNLTGAPSARKAHSAVWTGSKMIVWGGYDGTNYLNTGGIYDPATDTWTTMSIMGAPSARNAHTAVWTGTRMVIWGGYIGTWLNTGGIYDPATDTWTAVSTIGVPSARTGHSAVWTGTMMIVWGGQVSTGYTNTGGLYDPAADTWTAMSITSAPKARTCTEVWTGTEMIVWGGYDGFALLKTGGIYNPAANTWKSSSITGSPSARSAHAMVWTGTEMIVWGGYDGHGLNTGGKLLP